MRQSALCIRITLNWIFSTGQQRFKNFFVEKNWKNALPTTCVNIVGSPTQSMSPLPEFCKNSVNLSLKFTSKQKKDLKKTHKSFEKHKTRSEPFLFEKINVITVISVRNLCTILHLQADTSAGPSSSRFRFLQRRRS